MGGGMGTLGGMPESHCFVCKDAGDVRVCDLRNCLKSYHPGCVGKQHDFIHSSDQYVCDWHKCSNCASDALYLCFCCPSSSACGDCFGKVDFVPVKQSKEFNMGFCRSCLNMAIVTEKDDAEEAKVVFGGTLEYYQILFKDYWTVLKDKERFTLLDLQLVSIRHKRSLKCKEGKDSDEYHKTDGKPLGDNDGAGPSSLLDTMDKPNEVQATFKRKKSGKKTYVGWGSKELIEFLSCIGKDTSKPLEHSKVTEVVKEYLRQKDPLYDKKKKSVMCDRNLHSLFGKRKLKYNMIHSLLETHLSENAISEDDSDGSKDDNGYRVKKKPRNSLEPKIPKSISGIDPQIAKSVPRINKNCLAALNQNNLNLIYLRKTLVQTLRNSGVTATVADPLEVGLDELPEGASMRHDTACEVAFEVTRVIDIDNDEDENGPSHPNGCDKQDIIDLVSDDDEDVHMEQREPEQAKCDGPEAVNGIAAHAHAPEAVNGVTVPTVRVSDDLDRNMGPAHSTSQAMAHDPVTVNGTGESDQGWLYMDPQGQEHGPFPMSRMRKWQQSGYFPAYFRVWKAGESGRRKAILLVDAMRSH